MHTNSPFSLTLQHLKINSLPLTHLLYVSIQALAFPVHILSQKPRKTMLDRDAPNHCFCGRFDIHREIDICKTDIYFSPIESYEPPAPKSWLFVLLPVGVGRTEENLLEVYGENNHIRAVRSQPRKKWKDNLRTLQCCSHSILNSFL